MREMTCRIDNEWCIYGANMRRGMCWRHYNRWKRSPGAPMNAPFPERVSRDELFRLYSEGYRQAEISRILGCSPGAVSRILSRSFRVQWGLI